MYKELQTDRLLIRPIKIEDKEFIYSLVNSDGWLRYIGNRNIKNNSDAEKYIQKIITNKNFFYSVREIWLQLKKSASFTTTSVEFINSNKITFERL